ncbi:MAG TPA: S8 family serine peptidase [Roseiflexaceae bacterium]|nr:S8 family serine peptidase [Roseiflexaceae bacterium]
MSKRLFASLSIMAIFGLLLALQSPTPSRASINTPDFQPGNAAADARKIDSSDTKPSVYIVQLAGEPLAALSGLPRRADSTLRGAAKPALASAAAQTYKAQLAAQHNSVLSTIKRQVSPSVKTVATYDTAFNGMALVLTGKQAAEVAKLPGVVAVTPEQIYQKTTDVGPTWIGANKVWDASVTGVYAATILGANQTPPVSSPATGRGIFTFDSASKTLSYNITITGAAQPFTAAHFHRDTDSSVVANLTSTGAGTYAGSVTLSDADAALLLGDDLYVNFHTAANPGGEVRGNITGYKGEGVVVGVLDSGINTTHPSFAEVGSDGYRHLNPLGQGNYKGACDPTNLPQVSAANPSGYNPEIECNNKLIGAWTFTRTFEVGSPADEPSPNDDDGHGTHTASTAAGNVVKNLTLNGATFPEISGVAPHANIIAYDVCGFLQNGSYNDNCAGAALLAAAEQAIDDGVDVINYSISGGQSPWTDPMEIAFRNARAAGIVVATSAGNAGPGAGTLGHVSPWLISSGAATHNRKLVNVVTDITPALPNIVGAGTTGPLAASTPLIYAGDIISGTTTNALCYPFSAEQAALVAGKIVICDRGGNGRVEKAQNAADAGAVGFILANNEASGDSLVADAFPIPGVHITYEDGNDLKEHLGNNPAATAKISGTTSDINDSNGDIMAGFSSRGPNPDATIQLLKPDVTAPGVDVLAAVANDGVGGPDIGLLSGTSMASPHTAGSAALLAGLYPTWTPGQIQTALATTALAPITKEDGTTPTTPFDSGSGRIRVERAAVAGLVLDETIANFIAANPADDGDPRTLNVANFIDPTCIGTCSWVRTVKSTLGAPATWTASTNDPRLTVSPSSFTIPAGGTQTFTVTMNAVGLSVGTFVYGRVTLEATGDVAPDAAFPVAIRPVGSELPSLLYRVAKSGTDTLVRQVKAIPYTGLTTKQYGLVKGEVTNVALKEGASSVKTLAVPANTARLVAEFQYATAPDADLEIFFDENGNGTLDDADGDAVCSSTSSVSDEYCELLGPDAGTYFVVTTNFAASGSGPDAIKLVTGVVPSTSTGNFTVSAPPTSTGGVIPVTITVNEPTSKNGDIWYGWFELTDTGTGISLGQTSFDFEQITPTLHLPIVRR